MPDPGKNWERGLDGPSARLEQEATQWFFRRDGGFTADEARAFDRWLRDDERHGQALEEIERTWSSFGDARDRVATNGAWAGSEAVSPSRRPWRTVILAAAAALAVGFGSWQMTRHFSGQATLSPVVGSDFAEQVVSERGGLRKMELPDGSSLALNADSAVEIRFTAAVRRVRLLRGEVHFDVAKNPQRPFIVEAHGVAVRAVGTAFNVRLSPETVEVLVTEGKVRVDDAARGGSLIAPAVASTTPSAPSRETEPVMVPGEKVVIPVKGDAVPAAAVVAMISTREAEDALAWRQRWLDYSDAPLSEIVADFNRFNQHRLVIADAALAGRRFGGTFPAGDYQSLVHVLEGTFGVVAERRERDTVLRLR